MRDLAVIDREIEELKKELLAVQGTPTEVYTRIVGYYRSVRNWNKGKKEEYRFRKLFSVPNWEEDRTERPFQPASYRFFFRQTCPNCPPVKALLPETGIPGTAVNVDLPEGMADAARFDIVSAPTVIFFDAAGRERARIHSVEELRRFTNPAKREDPVHAGARV
jgi:ribonucleoside-triphosphate reductase